MNEKPITISFSSLNYFLDLIWRHRDFAYISKDLLDQILLLDPDHNIVDIQYEDQNGTKLPIPAVWRAKIWQAEYTKWKELKRRSEERITYHNTVSESIEYCITMTQKKYGGRLDRSVCENLVMQFYRERNLEALKQLGIDVEQVVWPTEEGDIDIATKIN